MRAIKLKLDAGWVSLLVLLLASVIFIIFIYLIYNSTNISTENIRYLLSTLAQSQATIIAIVISLTLIAVQLASQAYSTRLVDIALGGEFWILMIFSTVSILYDIALLSIVPENSDILIIIFHNNYYYIDFRLLLLLSFILIAITFLALLLYLRSTIRYLKPENIIKRLLNKVKPKDIERYIKKQSESDPLIPAEDVIRRAISLNDEATVIECIKGLIPLFEITEEYVIDTYPEITSLQDKKYSTILLESLESKIDEKSRKAFEIYMAIPSYFGNKIAEIGILCCDKGLYSSVIWTTEALRIIGETLARRSWHSLEGIILAVIHYLKTLDDRIKKEVPKLKSLYKTPNPMIEWFLSSAIAAIGHIGRVSAERKLGYATKEIVQVLGEIGISACKVGLEFSYLLDWNLGPRRLTSVIDMFWDIEDKIVQSLTDLRGSSEDIIEDVISGTIDIRSDVPEWDLLVALEHCILALKTFGKEAIQKNWEDIANRSAHLIMDLANHLIEKDYDLVYKPLNPIQVIAESITEMITSSNSTNTAEYNTAYYLTKRLIPEIKEVCKSLARKCSWSLEYALNLLVTIYNFIYSNWSKHAPPDMLLGAPRTLGEIAEIAITKNLQNVVDKISDNIKNLAIKASMSFPGASPDSWEYIVEQAIRYLILLGTLSIKNGNKNLAVRIARRIEEINVKCKNELKGLVRKILDENMNKRSYGVTTEKEGVIGITFVERKMTEEEFEAFKEFRLMILSED